MQRLGLTHWPIGINIVDLYVIIITVNTTIDRGIRLLEFICYNYMIVANTLGINKSSRIVTWHSPDGKTNNQIDYIIMKRRFKSDINVAKTRVYNNADIGSDYDLVMILQTIIQISKKTKEHSQKLYHWTAT